MVVMALLAPHDPYTQNLALRMVNPIWHADGTWQHPLGTDGLGRDYLSRLIYGSRISLLIGFGCVPISGLIGSALGVAAGYFGGQTDLAVVFMITTRLSMLVVLVALAVVGLVGGSLTVVVAVLGLLLWDRFAVVMRAAVQQIRGLEYVAAAEAAGSSTLRILVRSVLPNVLDQLLVVATLKVAQAVLLEAALSFLGLGVQPPAPSWGLMVSEAKEHMFFSPWLITLPGAALFTLVLAINLLGDGLRDVAAPRRER
ncbi:MAG: ABC transporter permease [candidate division NC10 bacterium]|nr:ABC transporter permease [candidate division NC10 bacterium]